MTANKMPPNPTPSYQSDQPARANKMPEMPEAALADASLHSREIAYYYTADQMRAMYLAGLAAAKDAVPARRNEALGTLAIEWNVCRSQTLANLSALEQGVGK